MSLGFKRLRPRIILTFRHCKGGRSSAKRTDRLPPRRNPWYSLSDAELTSGHMVLSGVPRKISPVTPPGIDPGTVRLVAQCLNHYATPGPRIVLHICNKNHHNANFFSLISPLYCLRHVLSNQMFILRKTCTCSFIVFETCRRQYN